MQLSGAPRTLLHNIEKIRIFWESNKRNKVVYFLTIWNDELTRKDELAIAKAFPNSVCEFLHSPNFDYQKSLCKHLPTDMKDFTNILKQSYGVWRCNNMRKRWQAKKKFKFDLVMRARPDEIYDGPAPFKTIPQPNIIYLPNHSHCSGLNDHAAVGTPEVIDVYADQHVWLEKNLCKIDKCRFKPYKGPFLKKFPGHRPILTPELNLEQYLRTQTKLDIKFSPIDYRTIRSIHLGLPFRDVPMMSAHLRDVIWL